MSKKTAKFLTGLVAIGAAGAGLFYWFKKKNEELLEDDFDNEIENEEFKLDEDLEEIPVEREYVSLTPSESKATEEAAEEVQESEVTEETAVDETEEPAE